MRLFRLILAVPVAFCVMLGVTYGFSYQLPTALSHNVQPLERGWPGWKVIRAITIDEGRPIGLICVLYTPSSQPTTIVNLKPQILADVRNDIQRLGKTRLKEPVFGIEPEP